jgi:hypothetical protein
MRKKKIFYIETTLNGYVFKKIPICDYEVGKDYCGELNFELDGEEKEYYEDVAGDYDELDRFLKRGSNLDCKEYDNVIGTKPHVYLEYFYTTSMGWFDDRFVGIMIGLE